MRLQLDGMTFKQREFVKLYLKYNGNSTEAAFEIYNCKNRNVVGVIGWKNLQKPEVNQAIADALEAEGMDADFFAQSLKRIIETGLRSGKFTGSDSMKGIEIVAKTRRWI